MIGYGTEGAQILRQGFKLKDLTHLSKSMAKIRNLLTLKMRQHQYKKTMKKKKKA